MKTNSEEAVLERIKHIKAALLRLAHDDFWRVVAFGYPLVDVRPRLAGAGAGALEYLAVVIGRVAPRAIAPEHRIDVGLLQRPEEVLNPMVQISIRILCDRMPVTVEDDAVALCRLLLFGGIGTSKRSKRRFDPH